MSFVSNSRRRGWLGCAGVTSLELALVLVPMLWMIMGTFDLARYLFTVQSMVTLMADAGRYAVISPSEAPLYCGTPWPNTATSAPLLDPTQVSLCIAAISGTYGGGGGVNQMQVTVTYPFTAITPGLQFLNTTAQNPLTETTIYAW